MVMGLIAGALAGGAKSASALADRVEKEAAEAKERAYKEGLLKWQLDESRKDEADRRDFELGKETLAAQMRAEEAEKAREFTASENEKNRKTELTSASIRSSSGGSSEKLPKPDKVGEVIVDPLTGTKKDVYGVAMKDKNGSLYYADPMTMQPLASQFQPQSVSSPAGNSKLDRFSKALSEYNTATSQPTKPASSATQAPAATSNKPVQGGDKRAVEQVRKDSLNRAIKAKQQEIALAGTRNEVDRVMTLNNEVKALVAERDK